MSGWQGAPVAWWRSRWWLGVEFGLLFFGLVGVFAVARVPGGPIPPLLLLTVGVVLYLRRQPDLDRRDLWRAEAVRPALPAMLRLWALAAVVAVAAVALFDRSHLFDLPRRAPLLWAVIVVAYPVFSVYPQELLFRAFLLHRYAPLWRTERAGAAAGAVAFGFAHVMFGNPLAVGLTLVGGWLFAQRYQQTRSLLVVCVEHAAYGLLIFTVGLGRYFYHGTA